MTYAWLAVSVCVSALYGQDLQVIHLPDGAATVLQAAYARKVEADAEWSRLERLAIKLFATKPGGGTAGGRRVETDDPVWKWGARFSTDYSTMVPKPEPVPEKSYCPSDSGN